MIIEQPIIKYFEQEELILLTDNPALSWTEVEQKIPKLTKGWYELGRLDCITRFEFFRDYWFNSLPSQPEIFVFIDSFFKRVDKISMLATKEDIFLTYTIKDCSDFFLGRPPLSEYEIAQLQQTIEFPLPNTFLEFYRIHNGFMKAGDTGILTSEALVEKAKHFKKKELCFNCAGQIIRGKSLLPFYRFSSLDVYQCFYKEWQPKTEVGNTVCYLEERIIANPHKKEGTKQIFPTFIEWLKFYTEARCG